MDDYLQIRRTAVKLLSVGDDIYEIVKGKNNEDFLIRKKVYKIILSKSFGEVILIKPLNRDELQACQSYEVDYNIDKHRYYFREDMRSNQMLRKLFFEMNNP